MTHPTLSNQIAGQMRRAEGLKRIRHEAAKKAWRTRRRLAKPSQAMRKILQYLASHRDARIGVHYMGRCVYSVSCSGITYTCGYPPRRTNRRTFRAMEKRGWFVFDRRVDNGGMMGTLPDGSQGIVERSFTLHYSISDKGRRVLEAANVG